MELGPEDVRVVGCLMEKQLTTPQQYPLSLNALVAACNQSSNRSPITSYDERTVETTLDSLKAKGLVRFVHPSHGRSVTRYRHVLDEVFDLDRRQLALLATLMVRGAQTPGELRSRTERMATFADVAEVEEELAQLADAEEPLVTPLTREPGHREVRYAQMLGGPAGDQPPSEERPEAVPASATTAPRPEEVPPQQSRDELVFEIAAIREEVAALRRALDHVLARLDH